MTAIARSAQSDHLVFLSTRLRPIEEACHPEFNQSYERARDIRADIAFGEQMLEIADADNMSDERVYKTGELTVSKEAVLRSRVRVEMRQWQMQRRHPLKLGDRQEVEVKDDFSRLAIEEKMQKAAELLSPRPGD